MSRPATISHVLAEMVLDSSQPTESARQAAKRMILDTVAVTLAGGNEPGCRELLEVLRKQGGCPEATVLGVDEQLPVAHAAWINATMAHAWDLDDVHIPSALHVMSVVWPVCLAVAQQVGASGRELVDSVVLGVEAACRLGISYNNARDGLRGRGFLPTSVVAGFGATAAAGRLMNLSRQQAVYAMGIHYAALCGNRQSLFEAALTKRLQPGLAARSACEAALLAEAGLTGPAGAIDGESGLFRLYLGAEPPRPKSIVRQGGVWEIERDSIKRYPCCGAAHGMIEAALALRKQYSFAAEQVQKVQLYWGPSGNGLVGRPFVMGEHPQVNAQFSAPYMVALALQTGELRLADLTDQAIRDHLEVADLAARVVVATSCDLLAETRRPPPDWPPYTGLPQAVTITLRNDQVLRQSAWTCDIFDPEQFTRDELRDKVRACLAYRHGVGTQATEVLITAVDKLVSASTLDPFLEAIASITQVPQP